MITALIDYGSGNLRSAENALRRAALDGGIETDIQVTDDPAMVRRADRIVLPGVGAFAACMEGLEARAGLRAALEDRVRGDGAPFLGICVGMQILADEGREHRHARGLGWIPGAVVRITPGDPACKVPHMGWNEVTPTRAHPLFDGIAPGTHFYFVHSYRFEAAEGGDVLATADHGGAITAALARGNIAGVQFHPEKSQAAGLRLLASFLRWRP
jgi:imidazole glycerol-phosphate synthase subunit HisH